MDMEVLKKDLGGEGMLDVRLEAGKLKLALTYSGHGANGGVSLFVDSDYFIDKLAEVIPGKVDDAIFAILKGALKA